MASLPYPRRPPNSFHRTHSKFACASPPTDCTEYTEASGGGYSPTDCTEYTEASGGGYSPTDFTDVHRFFFSASRFCVFREFCGKIVLWLPYPRCPPNSFHRTHSKFACASPPTDAHRCTQMVWLRRVLPQIAQIFTEVGGYGIPAIPTPPSEFLP